jgi:hypothetical protein
MGGHCRADLIDFIHGQFTGTGAREYSVVFLSRHTFFSFSFLVHSLACLISASWTQSAFQQSHIWQVRERQPARRPAMFTLFDFFMS